MGDGSYGKRSIIIQLGLWKDGGRRCKAWNVAPLALLRTIYLEREIEVCLIWGWGGRKGFCTLEK